MRDFIRNVRDRGCLNELDRQILGMQKHCDGVNRNLQIASSVGFASLATGISLRHFSYDNAASAPQILLFSFGAAALVYAGVEFLSSTIAIKNADQNIKSAIENLDDQQIKAIQNLLPRINTKARRALNCTRSGRALLALQQ
ncbi:MAG TPA: hypothetical protein DIS76_06175 [Rhodospirillaceae bacterium]|nr:hypothetical protein [Rhodospirillaceae bacterium]